MAAAIKNAIIKLVELIKQSDAPFFQLANSFSQTMDRGVVALIFNRRKDLIYSVNKLTANPSDLIEKYVPPAYLTKNLLYLMDEQNTPEAIAHIDSYDPETEYILCIKTFAVINNELSTFVIYEVIKN